MHINILNSFIKFDVAEKLGAALIVQKCLPLSLIPCIRFGSDFRNIPAD